MFLYSDESLSSIGSSSPSSSTSSMDSPHPQSGKDIFFQVKQESERKSLILDVMNQNSAQVWILFLASASCHTSLVSTSNNNHCFVEKDEIKKSKKIQFESQYDDWEKFRISHKFANFYFALY